MIQYIWKCKLNRCLETADKPVTRKRDVTFSRETFMPLPYWKYNTKMFVSFLTQIIVNRKTETLLTSKPILWVQVSTNTFNIFLIFGRKSLLLKFFNFYFNYLIKFDKIQRTHHFSEEYSDANLYLTMIFQQSHQKDIS